MGTGTRRAPCASAIDCEPSVEPLSAMTTSPAMPFSRSAALALSMQVARVSASLRQGMTMVSSSGDSMVGDAVELMDLPRASCSTAALRALRMGCVHLVQGYREEGADM